jgi:indolepyruvate ferredoxin oxidoreductase
MMYNPQIPFADVDAMAHLINQYTLSGANVFIDTQAYAIKLFGDHIFANIFHLGVAYQAGCIPLKADYLEQAIRINGQAVDINIQAFRWGRMAIVDRGRLDGMLSPPPKDIDIHIQDCMRGLSPGDAASFRELIGQIPLEQEFFRRLWTGRIADLIAYQNVAYARRYVNQMVRVFEADRNNGGEEHHYLLTNGAAEMFYKLMAYKDEYEVARLLTGPSEKKIRDAFDGPVKLSYHLHPPVLRERGLNRKLSFGPWFRPVLLLMAKCKGLRGKLFDPFGRSAARREERALIGWYETLIEQTLSILSPATYPDLVELLRVPDAIRGYEKIKQRSIDRTRRQAEEILINIKGKTEQKQVSTED